MSEAIEAMAAAGHLAMNPTLPWDTVHENGKVEWRRVAKAMREAAPVDEPVAKLQAMRRMCEASGQPFYVEILDEVIAALAAGDEADGAS